MPINNLQCRSAKPLEKTYKIHDSNGLYLKVMPNGSRYWRLKYRLLGKDKEMSLGVYPEVSLQEARQGRDEARAKIRQGLDPSLIRLEQRQLAAFAQENTCEEIAREWLQKQVGHWSSKHAQTVQYRLDK